MKLQQQQLQQRATQESDYPWHENSTTTPSCECCNDQWDEEMNSVVRYKQVNSPFHPFSHQIHERKSELFFDTTVGRVVCSECWDDAKDDANDYDLSLAQELRQNPAFRCRTRYSDNVSGFADGMKLKSEFISDWDVTLCGAPIMGGRKDSVRLLLTFTEFKGLGDPLIIGNPTLDRYGGLDTIRRHVWLAGV